MKKTDISQELKQLIRTKESEIELEGRLLKIHFQRAYESLKPLNIIKSTIKQVISSPEVKTNVVDTVIGFASGFIAKKILVGKSNNVFSKLLGSLIEMTVANKVTQNADEIKLLEEVRNYYGVKANDIYLNKLNSKR